MRFGTDQRRGISFLATAQYYVLREIVNSLVLYLLLDLGKELVRSRCSLPLEDKSGESAQLSFVYVHEKEYRVLLARRRMPIKSRHGEGALFSKMGIRLRRSISVLKRRKEEMYGCV